MKYFEQDYEMLRKQKKENKNNVKKFLESFIESGIYCVKVVDDEKLCYNNVCKICKVGGILPFCRFWFPKTRGK